MVVMVRQWMKRTARRWRRDVVVVSFGVEPVV
jgi:hypothetical protein